MVVVALGCVAVSHQDWIESAGRAPVSVPLAACGLWSGLIVARICLRADFDLWYAYDFALPDLLLHQASILVGCAALFMIAGRIRCGLLIHVSGASFFIYLVHEFPLRAVVQRLSDRFLDHGTSCWILIPAVLLGCYGAMTLLNRTFPALVAVVTGGRTPLSAAHIARPSTPSLWRPRMARETES